MKQVLIIDTPAAFREFLKVKLQDEDVVVETAECKRDAFTRMVSLLPDVIIIDADVSIPNLLTFLQNKAKDPNASSIPVIVIGKPLNAQYAALFARLNILKYFNKPVKFDILFSFLSSILHISCYIDPTDSIVDIHLNNDIIMLEIARGLNRDKIALLKYKLGELINDNNIVAPKLILILTGIEMSYRDGINIEYLLDTLLDGNRIHKKNLKVLSFDSFTAQLIGGHDKYSGIEIVTNLTNILHSLTETSNSVNAQDLISNKILTQTNAETSDAIEAHFWDDGKNQIPNSKKTAYKIAVVDDDAASANFLKSILQPIHADCDIYLSGRAFIDAMQTTSYDLIFLDLIMPELTGFDILTMLKAQESTVPVIVCSADTERADIQKALSKGARQFITKPIKTSVVLNKALACLSS